MAFQYIACNYGGSLCRDVTKLAQVCLKHGSDWDWIIVVSIILSAFKSINITLLGIFYHSAL